MLPIDFNKHNEQVLKLQEEKRNGIPSRMEMTISCNPRMILSDPNLNTNNITFENYMKNPQQMMDIQCQFQEYSSNNIIYDRILGFDSLKELTVYTDLQNVYEPSYYGCEVAYHGIYEPGTKVLLNDDNKYSFVDKPFPSCFDGLAGNIFTYYDYFTEQIKAGRTYKGKPIVTPIPVDGCTDGPFTLACCLLGATEMCIDLYEDEAYAMALLEYITDSTIYRIKQTRKHYGYPEKRDGFFFADDSIAMLSCNDYQKFILPFHKKLIRELSTGVNPNGIHLCGDASRHFKTIANELNVNSFDTGFPIHHGALVQELGPNITISGGVHVSLLQSGTPDEIKAEAKRIIDEVKPHTKNFIMKEANNLSPATPPKNILALYEAVKEYGIY
ncbi:uroporphyrinogen decarboxylase family protein [Paludicola sp. MB14-C6]|uniref:uroporphyrinogen decarboxylase family protein n=1 Tax=Paludihabitans sp. MB14-C6 TaxID=3070656 RepID=UPI0027DBDE45|nr:uroporphyrinogen decarboxylase family protein [Paludicola sp. MB14-C6]WMJ24426.1 uroporphyrinogen decarboxylase family protein [Paludicola sp. MB14-C6]